MTTLPLQTIVPAPLDHAGVPQYAFFDWLRFVLASAVVLDHAGLFHGMGGMAVNVFFVLSGWLIGGILLRAERADLPRFFFNRSTRIWIPYLVAIVLLYGVAAAKEGIGYYWFKYLFFDVTFTHNVFTIFPQAKFEMPLEGSGNQFWSIAVEEQFYLLAPFLMIFTRWGQRLEAWLAIAVLLFAIDFSGAAIVLGVIAAIAQRNHGDWHLTGVARVILVAIVSLSIVALLLRGPGAHVAAGFLSIGIVLLCAAPTRRSAIGVFLGGVSYPLYLNHWIGLIAVSKLLQWTGLSNPWLRAAASLLVSVAICAVLYLAVDRVVAQRRDRWFGPRLGRALIGTAATLVGGGLAIGGFL